MSGVDQAGEKIGGFLHVGFDPTINEVIINLDKDRTGHLTFSPKQARQLAALLTKKAAEVEMKVWQLNECDWWLAPSVGAAIDEAMKQSGLPFDELVPSPNYVHQLDGDDLRRLVFVADDGTRRSFHDEYYAQIVADSSTVRLFASECY